jgi:hypothetical protein
MSQFHSESSVSSTWTSTSTPEFKQLYSGELSLWDEVLTKKSSSWLERLHIKQIGWSAVVNPSETLELEKWEGNDI